MQVVQAGLVGSVSQHGGHSSFSTLVNGDIEFREKKLLTGHAVLPGTQTVTALVVDAALRQEWVRVRYRDDSGCCHEENTDVEKHLK